MTFGPHRTVPDGDVSAAIRAKAPLSLRIALAQTRRGRQRRSR
jgi:hypothetical protein